MLNSKGNSPSAIHVLAGTNRRCLYEGGSYSEGSYGGMYGTLYHCRDGKMSFMCKMSGKNVFGGVHSIDGYSCSCRTDGSYTCQLDTGVVSVLPSSV